ncbi:DUF4065 domain-containing protein [candidate division KSB1 bacterium]|nr:DUF4065 domain-containing protein [candidate division KSB1 bacterium]MBL7093131.1 DUF4065 domain-containing protein [candidate division KSB1 bacterium]
MNNTSKHTRFAELVRYIASQLPGIKTLQLVKTIYFLELEYKVKFGENLTEVPIIRLPMGPVSANYKSLFKKFVESKKIKIKKHGQSIQYFSSPTTFFDKIEVEIFEPVVLLIKKIIQQNPYGASEIIKGLSYQTFPMERFVQREKEDNELHIGWKVLQPPYFTKKDVDQFAKERRALRNHLQKALPFTQDDAITSLKVAEEMAPYLSANNEIGTIK